MTSRSAWRGSDHRFGDELSSKVDDRLGELPIDHLGQLSIKLGNDDKTGSDKSDGDRDIEFALCIEVAWSVKSVNTADVRSTTHDVLCVDQPLHDLLGNLRKEIAQSLQNTNPDLSSQVGSALVKQLNYLL